MYLWNSQLPKQARHSVGLFALCGYCSSKLYMKLMGLKPLFLYKIYLKAVNGFKNYLEVTNGER